MSLRWLLVVGIGVRLLGRRPVLVTLEAVFWLVLFVWAFGVYHA